jgi:ATP-dependent Clp protease adaptor protein ClpS
MHSWFSLLSRAESAPSEAPAIPDIELVEATDTQTQLDPPYKVLLHNDDVTPYDFVVNVLRTVFGFSLPKAVVVTQAAHFRGIALVGVYPQEDAKYKVGEAHGMARAEGFPLTLTIEPAE